MLKDRIIHKALGADSPVETHTSRCVRMRFNKNTCSACASICKANAISLDGGVSLDAGKCTLCMLCVSECPSGCFEIKGHDFFSLLARLRKIENQYPVLGCKKTEEAHEKTFCLGFLSEEHLIASAEFLEKPLYLNLTACVQCESSFIVEKLKERIEKAKAKASLDVPAKIVLVEKKSDLVFEDISYDRRRFFQTLKTMTFAQVAGLLDEGTTQTTTSYSAKKIPLKRELLNRLIKKKPSEKAAAGILENYAFNVKAGTSCNNCFACIGMCPTGALKIKKDADGVGLLFNSSLCTGCALCRDFCGMNAITVTQGFAGSDYFQFDICNDEAYASYDGGRQKLTENLHSGEVYSSHGKHIEL